MEINTEKTKMMTNNAEGIREDIRISDKRLETVNQFKYLGMIVTDKGSKPEILSRGSIDNTCNVLTEDHLERQKHFSQDKNKADVHTCTFSFSLYV